jgi:hypothetical protein
MICIFLALPAELRSMNPLNPSASEMHPMPASERTLKAESRIQL